MRMNFNSDEDPVVPHLIAHTEGPEVQNVLFGPKGEILRSMVDRRPIDFGYQPSRKKE
jgi:hypothetical protein